MSALALSTKGILCSNRILGGGGIPPSRIEDNECKKVNVIIHKLNILTEGINNKLSIKLDQNLSIIHD